MSETVHLHPREYHLALLNSRRPHTALADSAVEDALSYGLAGDTDMLVALARWRFAYSAPVVVLEKLASCGHAPAEVALAKHVANIKDEHVKQLLLNHPNPEVSATALTAAAAAVAKTLTRTPEVADGAAEKPYTLRTTRNTTRSSAPVLGAR